MKIRNKILIGVGVVTAVAVAAVGGYFLYQYRQFGKNLFLERSTLNGMDVSCMSVDGAYEVVYEDSQKKEVALTANGVQLATLRLSEFCEITIDKSAIQKGMEEITFSDFLHGKSRQYQTKCEIEMDRQKAEKYTAQVLSSIPQEASKNAKIKKTEDGFVLKPESQGTVIARKKLVNKLEQEIENIAQNKVTSIDVAEFYKKPKVTQEDLEADYEKLDEYLEWSVTYQDSDVTIGGEDLFPYIAYDNKERKIEIDSSFLRNKVYALSQDMNTVGKAKTFHIAAQAGSKKAGSGQKISVSGGTYGFIMDTEAEYQQLVQLMEECKSKKHREPVWSRQPRGSRQNEIGDTYIEISIDRQHLWYYVDGVLSMETDIVTGMKGKHDTPTGVYYITERINGKYLVGDTYRTWVNKWMRLTNMGIGLHDATWKSSFGGTIYTYAGSHGCINLPYSFACDLFDSVFVGLPVIIYDLG